MSTPDQHTAYVLEVSSVERALQFHLTSRVFPYWTPEQVRVALPALKRAIAKARRGDWDANVRWLYQDGQTENVKVYDLFKGLNLWGFEES